MDNRKLIGDPKLIDLIISRATIDSSDDTSTTYIDTLTKEVWLKYNVTSMYIEGQMTNLIRLPEPTTTDLINIVFSSEHDDEIIAASLRLRDKELFHGQEFRDELLNKIIKITKRNLDKGQKTRVKTIITLTELAHGENRRDVMGKTTNEIMADSDFFMNVAYKADEIFEALK